MSESGITCARLTFICIQMGNRDFSILEKEEKWYCFKKLLKWHFYGSERYGRHSLIVQLFMLFSRERERDSERNTHYCFSRNKAKTTNYATQYFRLINPQHSRHYYFLWLNVVIFCNHPSILFVINTSLCYKCFFFLVGKEIAYSIKEHISHFLLLSNVCG